MRNLKKGARACGTVRSNRLGLPKEKKVKELKRGEESPRAPQLFNEALSLAVPSPLILC